MHLSMSLAAMMWKNKGEVVSDVLVLWCQLLKWKKQPASAPVGTSELVTSVYVDERARLLPLFATRSAGFTS